MPILMDYTETEFLQIQYLKLWSWKRFSDANFYMTRK